MRRRDFITLLGSAAVAWPLAARAQQGEQMRRIGVLMSTTADDPVGQARRAAFLCTLLAYEQQFELGPTLGEAKRSVHLNHPNCAKFCVLGGASCRAG